jgi:hypothetical protein
VSTWREYWAAEREALRERLQDRALRSDASDREPSEAHRRAARTLLGWAPLVIIIFWTTLILTRAAIFTDSAPLPRFDVAAYGGPDDVIVLIAGSPQAVDLELHIPAGISRVTVGDVAGGNACWWTTSGVDPGTFRYADAFSAPQAGKAQTVIGRSVTITPGKSLAFEPLYDRMVATATATCHTEWRPRHIESSTYAMKLVNADVSNAVPAPADKRGTLDVYAPETDDARVSSLAGKVVPTDDYRAVVPTAVVWIDWRPARDAAFRDLLLIVIGALIALGAALLIECVRAYVAIAIEGPAGAGPPS